MLETRQQVRREVKRFRGRATRRRGARDARWAALEARYPESVYDLVARRLLDVLGFGAPKHR